MGRKFYILIGEETLEEAKKEHEGSYRSREDARSDLNMHKSTFPKGTKFRIVSEEHKITKWAQLTDEGKNLLEWVENPFNGQKQTIPVAKSNDECLSYLSSKEGKEHFKKVKESTTHIYVTTR